MNKSLFKIVTVLCTAFCGLTMVACSTGGESTTNENNNQNTEEEETSITFADFIAKHSDKAVKFYNDNFSGITAGKDVLAQTVSIGANSKDELDHVTVSCLYKVDDTKRKLDIVNADLVTPVDLDDIVENKVTASVEYTPSTTSVFEFDAKENKNNTELKDALLSAANVDAELFSEVSPAYSNARTFNLLSNENGTYTVGEISVLVDDNTQENLLAHLQDPAKVVKYSVPANHIYSTAKEGDATIISTAYSLADETFKNGDEKPPVVDPENPPVVEEKNLGSIDNLIEKYSNEVNTALNDTFLNRAGKQFTNSDFSKENVIESKWDLGENANSISQVRLIMTSEYINGANIYSIGTVKFNSPINLEEHNKDEINQIFKEKLAGATYQKDYSFQYKVAEQDKHDDLVNAIFAACDHELTEGSTILFSDMGHILDSTLNEAHGFKIAEITNDKVQEYTVRVKEASSEEGYINNLEKENGFIQTSQQSQTLSGNFVKEMAQKEDIATTANFIKFNKLCNIL